MPHPVGSFAERIRRLSLEEVAPDFHPDLHQGLGAIWGAQVIQVTGTGEGVHPIHKPLQDIGCFLKIIGVVLHHLREKIPFTTEPELA